MELLVVVVLSLVAAVSADTPANCTYDDIRGTWTFSVGQGGFDRSLNCSQFGSGPKTLTVTFYFPDLVVDQNGNQGFWTLIYNQGFEFVISGRKYLAFSKYVSVGKNFTSVCDHTMPGWSHDIFDRNWACIIGKKNTAVPPKSYVDPLKDRRLDQIYGNDDKLIEKINSHQSLWRAGRYEEYEEYTVADMIRRAGGSGSRILSSSCDFGSFGLHSGKIQARQVPEAFDWRNVNGVNYISPVRNQVHCGSCYAFASMALNEARVRVMTNNSQQPVFSPQDVVECSEYSQGCAGGFTYLIGGKYAEDFGLVTEECNPYKAKDGPCSTSPSCPRHYSTKYEYIGGFYGGCNEELMKINLVKYGPIAVGFEVYKDFFHYKGGIYHHTGLRGSFNPFEIIGHAVLVVGYGVENGVKFWIVKNSFGSEWGEHGYFRILRSTDECGIESMAVQSFPVL